MGQRIRQAPRTWWCNMAGQEYPVYRRVEASRAGILHYAETTAAILGYQVDVAEDREGKRIAFSCKPPPPEDT